MKKSVFVISFFLLLSLFFSFVYYLNNYETNIKKEIEAKKKEISLKTLRNSILLLNFYEPVELYLDYPIKTSEFYNFTNLNIKFCKETIIYKKVFLYYDKKKNCVIVNK
ncbi:MAG TPA: hypothetical protein EYH54_03595 [Nautiliaceae bacterium]|nr:hypothetical protein [Nautiliaceae bacterium]